MLACLPVCLVGWLQRTLATLCRSSQPVVGLAGELGLSNKGRGASSSGGGTTDDVVLLEHIDAASGPWLGPPTTPQPPDEDLTRTSVPPS